jgi:hypothetical protein
LLSIRLAGNYPKTLDLSRSDPTAANTRFKFAPLLIWRARMPTLYAAQLIETETPWLEIWNRMYKGLLPYARQILVVLGYCVERDLEVSSPDAPRRNKPYG